MALTPSEKTTLKTHIEGNTTTLAFGGGNDTIANVFAGASLDAGDATIIADWYNLLAVPTFWVFMQNLSKTEAIRSIDWVEILSGSPVDAGEQWAFDTMFQDGGIDPGVESNRNGLNQIFGGQTTTKQQILAASTEQASNVQKVFSSSASGPGGGNGSAQTLSATTTFFGTLTGNDISDIHGLP